MIFDAEKINKQRISAYQLIDELERRNRTLLGRTGSLVRTNRRLVRKNAELKNELIESSILYKRVMKELAKKRPDRLSATEWQLVLESRGIC